MPPPWPGPHALQRPPSALNSAPPTDGLMPLGPGSAHSAPLSHRAVPAPAAASAVNFTYADPTPNATLTVCVPRSAHLCLSCARALPGHELPSELLAMAALLEFHTLLPQGGSKKGLAGLASATAYPLGCVCNCCTATHCAPRLGLVHRGWRQHTGPPRQQNKGSEAGLRCWSSNMTPALRPTVLCKRGITVLAYCSQSDRSCTGCWSPAQVHCLGPRPRPLPCGLHPEVQHTLPTTITNVCQSCTFVLAHCSLTSRTCKVAGPAAKAHCLGPSPHPDRILTCTSHQQRAT